MAHFDQVVRRYYEIFNGAAAYGEGTAAEQAARFRKEEMQDLLVERMRQNSTLPEMKVDLLVSLSGFSPTTTIMAYEVLRPQRLLVISSEKAIDGVDEIGAWVMRPNKLRHRDFTHKACDPADPHSILELIEAELKNRGKSNGTQCVIDITGGKKVMSATGALAAWDLDLSFCYVDSEFDKLTRQPCPGTEVLRMFRSPRALFENHQLETTVELFNSGGFEEAHALSEQLAARLERPRDARDFRDLSDFYARWRNLDFARALVVADELLNRLPSPRIHREKTDLVHKQRAFVERLRNRDRTALLLNHFLLGKHYADKARFEFATLLFYRCMEGCFSERLAARAPGFDYGEPDYALLTGDVAALERAFLAQAAHLKLGYTTLPYKLGFLTSALLLRVLGDGLVQQARLDDDEGLQRLMRLSMLRNQSVLAHGYEHVPPEKAKELEEAARALLACFWNLGKHTPPIHAGIHDLKFVDL